MISILLFLIVTGAGTGLGLAAALRLRGVGYVLAFGFLLLVSLAFVSAAGFLGLHALATPGVLIGKNAGFELATPLGLVLAGVFAAAKLYQAFRLAPDHRLGPSKRVPIRAHSQHRQAARPFQPERAGAADSV